jgi:hypothetical protein
MSAGARARAARTLGAGRRARPGSERPSPRARGGRVRTQNCVTTLSTVVAASFFNENELIENKAKRKEKANAYG